MQGRMPNREEISFCITDMKFNKAMKPEMRILEFGDGARSRFDGYDPLFERGAMWALFWKHLASLGMPFWCIDPSPKEEHRSEIADKTFLSLGGKFASNGRDLIRKLKSEARKKNINLKKYKAAVFIKFRREYRMPDIKYMRKNIPGLIFVGEATAPHVRSKFRTNLLFKDSPLQHFRPSCLVCPKEYSSDLIKDIFSKMNREIYVIKPINSTRSQGVIPVYKEDLDKTLQLILRDKHLIRSHQADDAYSYWLRDRNDVFLLEEYIPSQVMRADGKEYDPTMRIVFVLHYKDGKANVTVLDGFWKLPAKALSDSGSLVQKHVSNVYEGGGTRSLKIGSEEMSIIKKVLPAALKHAYVKMLMQWNV